MHKRTSTSISLILCTLVLLLVHVQAQQSWEYCRSAFLNLAVNNGSAFALMFDATGKSIDDLGKWDQCIDLGPHVSHYCTIRFALNVSIPSPYMGLCVPANCSAADVANLTQWIINYEVEKNNGTNPLIDFIYEKYEKFVQYQNKEGVYEFYCAADTPSIATSAGGIAMIIISVLLIACVVFGTALDGYDANWWPEIEMTNGPASPVGGIQDSAEVAPLLQHKPQQKSMLFNFFVAFSLARNFKSLIGPSPPALSFLNGMRAISITWVILGHSLDYMNYAGVLNFAHVVTKDVEQASAQVFPAAEFSVDSFFWLSGFLITYLTVQELKSKKRVNWFLYYFHRVWRLSPAYFYALFFYMCVSVYLSDGPMWPRYMGMVQETCGKYWWTNVLYVNNFIPSVWKNQCFLWGWYLAVDMQLYIVAPIVFLLYHKNRYAGWALVIIALVATTVANGALAHIYHFVWNSADPSKYMTTVYGKPYMRAAPWLLGIACGFLYLEKRQLNRLVVYVGWAISGAVMLLCVYGPARQFKGGSSEHAPINTWGTTDNFMYFTFSKLGWSLALSFLMYSMAMGWGGIIRRFLGAQFWNPLARLTYSTYLFHPIIMFVVYYSHRQYFSYDSYYISIMFVGVMFLSFCVAGVMFLAIERPMTNMEKLFLPHKKN